MESFQILVEAKAGKKLRGDETLELSIGGTGSGAVVLGGEDCGAGGIKAVEGEGLCLEDNKTAQFVYTVSVDPNVGSEQTYGYKFASQNVEGVFTSKATIKTEEGEIVSSSDLAAGEVQGEITVLSLIHI